MAFSQKQMEFFENASHRWNLKVGATRSGKTYADYYVIPKRIRSRKDKDGLNVILGVSKATIERNILDPMRRIWGPDLVGHISSNNTCYLFGERAHCLGAEKISQVSKIRGSSIKYCYGDEVADWSPEVFELLKSRLDKPYSCFDGALNPQSPNHWLKAFLDSNADIYAQKYTIFDNPFLSQEFVNNLCAEYEGTVYYKRYILGEWALAEGLIYPMYQEAIGEMPELKEGEERVVDDYCISLDYGTQNAFACYIWVRIKNVWYAIDEYYYSGRETGQQKTDEEYAQDLDKFVGENLLIGRRDSIQTIVDPSAASFITLLAKRNGRYSVLKANNNVADGIRETAVCMKNGKIKISSRCKNLINELQGYAWDESSSTEDKPIKINDHGCDAVRYFVKTKNIQNASYNYRSIFF